MEEAQGQAEIADRDAKWQPAGWLRAAIKEIDAQFGEEGYAKRNPQLVAAMVMAGGLTYHATWLANAIEDHGLHSGS